MRNINGIVLLDKPIGLSSNKLLQKVKHIFHAYKAGHTGTLDPLATGMLPICLGEATKFSQYLLNANKCYHVIAKLGERTYTSDTEGKIINIRDIVFNESQLMTALDTFRGVISQIPPMFSALKYKGIPLYKYARKGIDIKRQARFIQIYNLKLLNWNSTHIALEISCSKGTYIRSIIDDLGELLGCGTHIQSLRRLTVAQYSTNSMVTLDTLLSISNRAINKLEIFKELDNFLLPIDSAIFNLPIINLSIDMIALLRSGHNVKITQKYKIGLVCLLEIHTKIFIGVGNISHSGYLVPCRLIKKS